MFSNQSIDTKMLNFYYNAADITVNIASNEGFGISWNESLHTGTPIINKPSEIAVLFNMIRGMTRVYNFTIKLKDDLDEITLFERDNTSPCFFSSIILLLIYRI